MNQAAFWDTYGKIKHDNQEHFKYENSMTINWENKIARRVLINTMLHFGKPNTFTIHPKGIAMWTDDEIKESNFYKRPILFKEITIKDDFVLDSNKQFIPNYPFMTIKYDKDLDSSYDSYLSVFSIYVNYDPLKKSVFIRSRTLEENLIILKLFLDKNASSKESLIELKNNLLSKLNNSKNFDKNIRNVIDSIRL